MKEKVIYSKKLAYQLRVMGFKLLKKGVNPHFPQFDTYIFEETAALLRAISEITKQ